MATPTIVLLPLWAPGHFMSTLNAGKQLLVRSGGALSLTVLIMQPTTERSASEVAGHIRREEASCRDIRFHRLPAVERPTGMVGILQFVSVYIQLHAPHVKAAIAGLPCPAAGLVMDFLCTTLLDVARELAVPAYVYFTGSAAACALYLRLPALHEEVVVEFGEMEGMVDVPGLPPLPSSSMTTVLLDKKNPNYSWLVYHGRRFMEIDGLIINTTPDVEQSVVLDAMADGRCTGGVPAPTVYAIGPVLSFKPRTDMRHECMRWLDAQPPATVVLLCFGSLGFFTAAQAHEVAHGLERSGHRFLWVLRGRPVDGEIDPTDANLDELLPEGFVGRTKERGLVWPTSAPQNEILSHAAVGGFVTHCGWNSILESVWSDVPMVPWPLYSEQHLNAFLLVACMGVAVSMEVDRKSRNFVAAPELERAVRALMDGGNGEGRKAREKATAMKAACREAVEEGGSSYSALGSLCEVLQRSE